MLGCGPPPTEWCSPLMCCHYLCACVIVRVSPPPTTVPLLDRNILHIDVFKVICTFMDTLDITVVLFVVDDRRLLYVPSLLCVYDTIHRDIYNT